MPVAQASGDNPYLTDVDRADVALQFVIENSGKNKFAVSRSDVGKKTETDEKDENGNKAVVEAVNNLNSDLNRTNSNLGSILEDDFKIKYVLSKDGDLLDKEKPDEDKGERYAYAFEYYSKSGLINWLRNMYSSHQVSKEEYDNLLQAMGISDNLLSGNIEEAVGIVKNLSDKDAYKLLLRFCLKDYVNFNKLQEDDAKLILNKVTGWYESEVNRAENANDKVERDIYKNLAIAYRMLDKYNESITYSSDYIKSYPTSKKDSVENESLLDKYLVNYDLNKDKTKDESKNILYAVVDSNDVSRSEGYLRRGQVYYKIENYNQAIDDFTAAAYYNPKNNDAYFYKALYYNYNGKDRKAAIADVNNAIKLYQQNETKETLKKIKEAINSYNEAIKAYNSSANEETKNTLENKQKELADAVKKYQANDVKKAMEDLQRDENDDPLKEIQKEINDIYDAIKSYKEIAKSYKAEDRKRIQETWENLDKSIDLYEKKYDKVKKNDNGDQQETQSQTNETKKIDKKEIKRRLKRLNTAINSYKKHRITIDDLEKVVESYKVQYTNIEEVDKVITRYRRYRTLEVVELIRKEPYKYKNLYPKYENLYSEREKEEKLKDLNKKFEEFVSSPNSGNETELIDASRAYIETDTYRENWKDLSREMNKAIDDYLNDPKIKVEIPKVDDVEEALKNKKRSNATFYYTLRGYINSDMNDLNKAIDLDKKNDLAYKYRGDLYLKLKDYDDAIKDYNEVIELRSTDKSKDLYIAKVYYDRGLCYKAKGDKGRANSDFYKAEALGHEKDPSAWQKLLKGVSKAKEYRKNILDILGLFAI